ncbi:MAG: winged helix-turn-helix domain-containing protein [Candidatus Nanoarchaeia archaeon]|nr:winged helix-turn-helix domain-containing protein [Candidatus Nanoarchaeia archaeon]
MVDIDKTDYIILKLLKENPDMSEKEVSEIVELSVIEVKKRINKLIKQELFHPNDKFFEKTLKKMEKLDEKDCIILNLLQENCRMSLSDISRKVNLSVDSVKNRIDNMIKHHIFFPKIQLRPRNFGFYDIVDIKIKLHNYTKKEIDDFVGFLENHQRVAEMFSVSGDWDFSIVIIAKDSQDLGKITKEIRNRFNRIISDWNESLTTEAYKFERYDMLKLMEYE